MALGEPDSPFQTWALTEGEELRSDCWGRAGWGAGRGIYGGECARQALGDSGRL